MAANIVRRVPIGDCYDVRFITAGEAHVLHFTQEPNENELSEALAAFETRLRDAAMTETEEGSNELFE